MLYQHELGEATPEDILETFPPRRSQDDEADDPGTSSHRGQREEAAFA